MTDLTLVIPAKFEKESLPIFLDELKKFEFKIIIVVEETDFDTINVLKGNNDIQLIFQNIKGYGAALIEGISNVNTKYFCIINADGSMNPNNLEPMLEEVKNRELDFLFTSRYEKNGGSDDDSMLTKVGNYFFTNLGNIFFNLKITDILYTYVIGSTKCFNELNLKSNDFTFCVEFPIKSNRKGYKIGTLPSYERKRIGGKKKVNEFKDGFLILIKMIKLFFRNE